MYGNVGVDGRVAVSYWGRWVLRANGMKVRRACLRKSAWGRRVQGNVHLAFGARNVIGHWQVDRATRDAHGICIFSAFFMAVGVVFTFHLLVGWGLSICKAHWTFQISFWAPFKKISFWAKIRETRSIITYRLRDARQMPMYIFVCIEKTKKKVLGHAN